ncbi:DUF4468 domain-containing protein [Pedobacter sp. Leaf170]|uniref:DUF4468 domain-containing protein n=1 Tax=Pedobacter sp. Leaf170 TaxID=2876558 RepID=UPI001E622C0E|nr:DUF4468 domain-containing protein [Pedobacter sp. Leaf170]
MKKLLSIAFLIISWSYSNAQSFKVDNDTPSEYKDNRPAFLIDSVGTSTLTKKQLYSNSINYITTAFKDSRDVIELKDLELGEVLFNGKISKQYKDETGRLLDAILNFKCKIYLKEGKYKIVLHGLEFAKSTFPSYSYQINVPYIFDTKEKEDPANKAGRELAYNLIKNISAALTKKPGNEF